jgi:sRNA-binding protein
MRSEKEARKHMKRRRKRRREKAAKSGDAAGEEAAAAAAATADDSEAITAADELEPLQVGCETLRWESINRSLRVQLEHSAVATLCFMVTAMG